MFVNVNANNDDDDNNKTDPNLVVLLLLWLHFIKVSIKNIYNMRLDR